MIAWRVQLHGYIPPEKPDVLYFDCPICAVDLHQSGAASKPEEVPLELLPNGVTVSICPHSGVRV